jgi:hypothetical protein
MIRNFCGVRSAYNKAMDLAFHLLIQLFNGLGRPAPTLVPCWSLNPCLQGTSVGVGLLQPSSTGWKIFGKSLIYLKNFKPVGAFNNEMKHICIQMSDAQAKKKEKQSTTATTTWMGHNPGVDNIPRHSTTLHNVHVDFMLLST